jgi:hypothetical protein
VPVVVPPSLPVVAPPSVPLVVPVVVAVVVPVVVAVVVPVVVAVVVPVVVPVVVAVPVVAAVVVPVVVPVVVALVVPDVVPVVELLPSGAPLVPLPVPQWSKSPTGRAKSSTESVLEEFVAVRAGRAGRFVERLFMMVSPRGLEPVRNDSRCPFDHGDSSDRGKSSHARPWAREHGDEMRKAGGSTSTL